MPKDWITVYSTGDLYRAEMAKQMIQEKGIEAVIMNQQDSAYLIFGEINVLVPAENEQAALEQLKNLELE